MKKARDVEFFLFSFMTSCQTVQLQSVNRRCHPSPTLYYGVIATISAPSLSELCPSSTALCFDKSPNSGFISTEKGGKLFSILARNGKFQMACSLTWYYFSRASFPFCRSSHRTQPCLNPCIKLLVFTARSCLPHTQYKKLKGCFLSSAPATDYPIHSQLPCLSGGRLHLQREDSPCQLDLTQDTGTTMRRRNCILQSYKVLTEYNQGSTHG